MCFFCRQSFAYKDKCIKNMNLIFLDTECTGVEEKDRLLQLAYLSEGGEKVNELFKPPVPISIEAMAVHHITEKMVAENGSFAGSIIKSTLGFRIDRGDIVVAHNAKFDIEMLRKEGLEISRYICTLKIARWLDNTGKIPSHSLQYLRYFLRLDVEATAHDAMGDVLVLRELFYRLLDKMEKNNTFPSRETLLEDMILISQRPSLIPRFGFGKHKGQLIAEVDKGYLEWMLEAKLKEDVKGGVKDEDMMYTLKYHLGMLLKDEKV